MIQLTVLEAEYIEHTLQYIKDIEELDSDGIMPSDLLEQVDNSLEILKAVNTRREFDEAFCDTGYPSEEGC